jgi:ADP-ribose pyrophosphatase YjhB (NUDIX family)
LINKSDFLTIILKEILEKPIVCDDYDKYNISRNSFSYYIKFNKPLSKKVAKALKMIVLETIYNDKEKEIEVKNFLMNFLTDNEKQELKNTNEVIKVGISKFSKSQKNKIKLINNMAQENSNIKIYPLMVVIGLVICENKILLVKRRDSELNLTWQFPAGILKKNKLPEIILEREVKSETNVICKVISNVGNRVHPDTGVVCKYYLCEYLSGDIINADPEENEDVQWVKISNYEKYITSNIYIKVRNILEQIKKEALSK